MSSTNTLQSINNAATTMQNSAAAAAAENSFGFSHLWAAGDVVSHSVAIILAIMSIVTWYLILAKAWDWFSFARARWSVAQFWAADSVEEGTARLEKAQRNSPYLQLARQASACDRDCEELRGSLATLNSRFDPAEQMERNLRQQLSSTQATLENGLTLLATIGATAPFVGLFGTVWGIYHALVAIGLSGSAALNQVAGPVGEALIITAAGLAVALPAVFAYNSFTRVNRLSMADLDAFAHDLHAFFTIGKPFVANSAQIHPMRAKLASQTQEAAQRATELASQANQRVFPKSVPTNAAQGVA